MFKPACFALALCVALPTAAAGEMAPAEAAFDLQVNIGRRQIFIERSMQAIGVELPFVRGDGPADPAAPEALWRALRETGREGAMLQALFCGRRLAGRDACATAAPAWISADPTPTPTVAALAARLEELDAYLAPFVDKGCTLGRRKTGDHLFCSVE